MGGVEHNAVVNSPEPVAELLAKTNAVPAGQTVKRSVVIRSQEVLFESNQVFSEWLPLHKAGIQANGFLIP